MSKPLIRILIQADSSNPRLLEGLEVWLNLGLLSDAQVRQIGELYLSDPLPKKTVNSGNNQRVLAEKITPKLVVSTSPQPAFQLPNFATNLVESLKAELSVRWLLFLGLFLVIISSGVLAASQWEKFPATGQYLILFAYTFAFWGASLWGSQQSRFPVTSEALKLVTLLLIPLNFWAMDGLKLWSDSLGLLTIAIAALALTILTVTLYRNQGQFQRRSLFNHLGLSYLNWGWQIPGFPVIAIYLGIMITVFLTIVNPPPTSSTSSPRIDFKIVVIYLLTLLFGRAIFVVNVDISQLGLALGIFAGFLYISSSLILHRSSYFILLFGWLVTVYIQPWQAFLVSGIGIGIFSHHLLKYWRERDLAAIFGFGLSMVALVGRLIPPELRKTAINVGVEISSSQDSPWALLSLTWFPYLIFMVIVTDWIYHRPQRKVAHFGDFLSLLFATFLTCLSLSNPALRSLNLLASTITLAVVISRRQPLKPIVVLATHILGLVTFANLVYWQFPNLALDDWAIILLILMVGEFLLFTVNSPGANIIRKDALDLGILLSGISYILFLTNFEFSTPHSSIMAWLITPLGLTYVATQTRESQQKKAVIISIIACGLVQVLNLFNPQINLWSLGLTTVFMVVNTQIIKTLFSSVFTVGLGLAFLFLSVKDLVTVEGWLIFLSLTIAGLWVLRFMLFRYGVTESNIVRLYQRAFDGWAITLLGFELSIITLNSFGVLLYKIPRDFTLISTLIILIAALSFRGFDLANPRKIAKSGFSPWILYSLAWAIELLIIERLISSNQSLVSFAVANIILGLTTQLFGDWWQRHYQIEKLPNPWQIIPIIYGILAIIFRVQTSANWTGLISLAFALILIGIGRRNIEAKPLVYLGLMGIYVSTYEILLYQINAQPLTEQWIAFATLGTSLMYGYRILSPWLIAYLQIPEPEITIIAHLHWFISSILLGLVISSPINSQLLLTIGTSLLLIRYALFQGRYNSYLYTAETWVYVGLIQTTGLVIYLQNLLDISNFLIPWSGSLVSILSYFFYILPWNIWGWPVRPWKRAAIILPVITVISSHFILQPEQQLTWYLSAIFGSLFYIILAKFTQNIRLTYLSLTLISFTFYNWLGSTDDIFIFTLPISCSLLYFSQVEPSLKLEQNRDLRHGLRVLGTGILCGTSLGNFQGTGILAGILSLATIFVGLGLKIRAFLYIGTAIFLINIVNQLIILNSIYSFIKWIIVFILGVILIWIAANFETRREQLITLWNNWVAELQTWE
ncbi:hypothetical protein L2E69_12125 [Planktothrix agardhii 1806]|uniref:hypothetical protein n=1 Tax=Planktothrix agardhii TaxID=1160 RepID=UPI0005A61AA4|nr:hypothetical protein [Planktothrix agardhii]MCF3571380.1 hypothetical protein [Planktothrix agardhii 1805]MCF3585731.1 hypothetical protein [Planktothrix agardhii 1803]MCF3602408.1 hypothetical protein [Planktothrix agardhii 1804]MCF3616682.1 hypothetical protein [Planktothrix agardhii 1806]CAD5948207.1 hypothetical protein NIVACYA_02822 [Planktothrix agardhii]